MFNFVLACFLIACFITFSLVGLYLSAEVVQFYHVNGYDNFAALPDILLNFFGIALVIVLLIIRKV